MHRLTGQAKTDVLPAPIATLEVDVAVHKVDADAVSILVTHDQHLAVVAVVGGTLQDGQRVERNAGNALLPQLAGVIEVEGREATETVVHHADSIELTPERPGGALVPARRALEHTLGRPSLEGRSQNGQRTLTRPAS